MSRTTQDGTTEISSTLKRFLTTCAELAAIGYNAGTPIPANGNSLPRPSERLAKLFAAVEADADAIRELAKHDMQAASLTAVASRTVAEIGNRVRPMIDAMRRLEQDASRPQRAG